MVVQVLRSFNAGEIVEVGQMLDASDWQPMRLRQLVAQRYIQEVLAPPTVETPPQAKPRRGKE